MAAFSNNLPKRGNLLHNAASSLTKEPNRMKSIIWQRESVFNKLEAFVSLFVSLSGLTQIMSLSDQRERRIFNLGLNLLMLSKIPRRFAPRNDTFGQMSTEPKLIGSNNYSKGNYHGKHSVDFYGGVLTLRRKNRCRSFQSKRCD